MDIIGIFVERGDGTAIPAFMPPKLESKDLLSQQVSGSRYFFLNLAGAPAGRCSLALGGREHCNPDYTIDRDRYAYHVLEYVAEGSGSAVLARRRQDLAPGSVFAYTPAMHCEMRTVRNNPMVKYFLCLAGNAVPQMLARASVVPGRVRRFVAHADIRNVFEDLIREGQHAGTRTREICAVLLELLVLKLADAVEAGGHPGELARENFLRCKALIDGQAERLATLRDISVAAGLDASSVCRLFRRYQGTSPYQYLLRRKMNIAAEFLIEKRGMVKEAALRVGFADPYHFSRCFKALHGVPPRDVHLHR
jgi:AraC family transcriptional regulator